MNLVILLVIFFNGCQATVKQENQQIDSESIQDQIVTKLEQGTIFLDCKKCDIDVVRKTEENLSSLSDDLLKTFLCGFDKKCYTNVEYSEYSNGTLYKVISKYPKRLLQAIDSMHANGNDVDVIYSEISSPLLDYDYDSLIEAFQKLEGSSEIKKKVVAALKKAKEG